VVNKLN